MRGEKKVIRMKGEGHGKRGKGMLLEVRVL